jgi:hypothetical protein
LEEYLRFLKVKIKIRKCIYFLQLYECLVFLSLIILEATTFRTSHIAVSRITFSVAILKAWIRRLQIRWCSWMKSECFPIAVIPKCTVMAVVRAANINYQVHYCAC